MKEFDNKERAIEWMVEEVDDPCIDNKRFAFLYSEAAMEKYEQQKEDGCCGSFDEEVLIKGITATVGCNYGH